MKSFWWPILVFLATSPSSPKMEYCLETVPERNLSLHLPISASALKKHLWKLHPNLERELDIRFVQKASRMLWSLILGITHCQWLVPTFLWSWLGQEALVAPQRDGALRGACPARHQWGPEDRRASRASGKNCRITGSVLDQSVDEWSKTIEKHPTSNDTRVCFKLNSKCLNQAEKNRSRKHPLSKFQTGQLCEESVGKVLLYSNTSFDMKPSMLHPSLANL